MKVKQKQKQVSIEEYIETYCQERKVRERYAVYVSPKTHQNLIRTVRLFASEHHTTTASLADSILTSHFETFRELLNVFQMEYMEYMGKLFGWSEDREQNESEEPEDQPDDIETSEKTSTINDEPVE